MSLEEFGRDLSNRLSGCGVGGDGSLLGSGSNNLVYSVVYEGRNRALRVSKTGEISWNDFAVSKSINSENVGGIGPLLGDTPTCNPGKDIPFLSDIGIPLDHLLNGKLKTDMVKVKESISMGLLKGLMDLHANGIIHGDIKPENSLVLNFGVEKSMKAQLIDFEGATISKDHYQNKEGRKDYNALSTAFWSDRNKIESLIVGRDHVVDTFGDIHALGFTLLCVWAGKSIMQLLGDVRMYSESNPSGPDGIGRRFFTVLKELEREGYLKVRTDNFDTSPYRYYLMRKGTLEVEEIAAFFLDRYKVSGVEETVFLKLFFIRLMTDNFGGSFALMIMRLLPDLYKKNKHWFELLNDMMMTHSREEVLLLPSLEEMVKTHFPDFKYSPVIMKPTYLPNTEPSTISYLNIATEWYCEKCPEASLEHLFAVTDRFTRTFQIVQTNKDKQNTVLKYYVPNSALDEDLQLFLFAGCLYIETLLTPENDRRRMSIDDILHAIRRVYTNSVFVEASHVMKAAKCVVYVLDGYIYANPYYDSLDDEGILNEMSELEILNSTADYTKEVMALNGKIVRTEKKHTFGSYYNVYINP